MKMNVRFVAYALRYYPNLVTGEFLNVGVLLVCPDKQWWDARFATGIKAVSRVFPTAQPKTLATLLRRIERRVHAAREEGHLAFELGRPWGNILEPVQRILGVLSGSLRWADRPIKGLTRDPAQELDYWFDQLVQISKRAPVLSDQEVRDNVRFLMRREFEKRGILSRLYPTEVGTLTKEVFEYTFESNGLNVFEQIGLNYSQPGRIRSQAQLWRGKIDSLNDESSSRFSFFALVDMPTKPRLLEAATEGLTVIERADATEVEAFSVDRIEEFGERVERVVKGG